MAGEPAVSSLKRVPVLEKGAGIPERSPGYPSGLRVCTYSGTHGSGIEPQPPGHKIDERDCRLKCRDL